MIEKKEHITTMHSEHVEWLKELNFARDEMASFKNRLSEVAMRNTVTDVLSRLEQFQNQIIRQNEVADQIEHEINVHEDQLVANAKSNTVAVDHRQLPDHVALRENMETFRKLFSEMKEDLTRFLAETL